MTTADVMYNLSSSARTVLIPAFLARGVLTLQEIQANRRNKSKALHYGNIQTVPGVPITLG